MLSHASLLSAGVAAASLAGLVHAQSASTVDKVLGWTALDAPSHFRGYKQPGFPAKGWSAKDGVFTHAAKGGGGDLITAEQFGDFEFEWEFKLAPKSNSGIMWRVAEKHDTTWQTGPEFQLLEDATYGVKPNDPHSCGALYDLVTPAEGKTMKPAGEWNTGRIWLRGGVLKHFLNGKAVVETRIDDQAWKDKIAASKFKPYEGFGVLPRGHIAIQDHGDEISLRNMRVRPLDAAPQGEIKLFNGKNLDGWTHFLSDNGKPETTWLIEDGMIMCKGDAAPAGYIRTKADYTNYILRLEWRFNPVTKKAGNSGVLLRMVGEDKVWPKSVEAQLHSGNAGDFWNIENYTMTTAPDRTKGRNTKKTHGAERPIGEWNQYEIIVNKGDIILRVNGEELNRATGVEVNPGKICLQAEGAEIHFRNITLVPLAD